MNFLNKNLLRRTNAVKDGDEPSAGGMSMGKASSMGGDVGWHGSRVSLVTTVDKEDVDLVFVRNNSLHSCTRLGDLEGLKMLLKVKKNLKNVDKLDDNNMAPLHYAARYNQLDCLRHLVEFGDADIVVRDKLNTTPLHYAAKKRENVSNESARDVIKYLAAQMRKQGIDMNVKDQYECTPLHFAAMRGNEIVTKALIEEGASVAARDYLSTTPLHEAVIYGHYDVVLLLLRNGADPTSVDDETITPLHLSAMQGNLKIAIKLVENTAENLRQKLIGAKDNTENTALHLAVENRHKNVVQYLLQHTTKQALDARCRTLTSSSTCLHLSAITGCTDIPELLIKKGASINVTDGAGMTPLHRAVEYNNNALAKMLLDAGASIDARDHDFFTPLLLGCCNNNPEGVKKLLKHGADICTIDDNENSTVRLAAEYNQVEVMKVLIKHLKKLEEIAFIDNPDRLGLSPLHIAASKGHADIVELLILNGADKTAKTEEEKTPFHLAAESGQVEVCRLILDATANHGLNDEDEDSNTALHFASKEGHLQIVQLLVDNGADKMARNVDQWTPLDYASAEGHVSIVKYLLSEDVPVNPMDKEKLTPLHLACKYGHLDIARALMDNGADVGERDREGNNALDVAIDNHHVEIASAIIESSNWRNALINETFKGKGSKKVRYTPLRKLVTKMPEVAHQALDKCVSHGPENTSPEEEEFYIHFNFEFVDDNFSDWKDEFTIDRMRKQEEVYESSGRIAEQARPYTDDTSKLKDDHMLMVMVNANRGELVSHPLTLALIRRKWNKASIFYYIFLCFYALFIALLSAYMLSVDPPYAEKLDNSNITNCDDKDYKQNNFEQGASLWMLIFAVAGMLLELFQLVAIRFKYLEPNNLFDWYTYVSTVLLVQNFRDCDNDERPTNWQWQLGVFTVFIAWMNFLLFLRRLPRIGIYVVMIVEIFKTFIRFFAIFFLFIVAFAICFTILLQNQDPFSNLWKSIVKTWVMMIGEMDFTDVFHDAGRNDPGSVTYEGSTYIIFVAFLVLMAIIVMNLLTGLAVDDVNALQANAEIKKVAMQIELALDVEVAMPYMVQRWSRFILRSQRLHPNKEGSILLKWGRAIIEGNYMSKEAVMDKVLGDVVTLDPNKEEKQYREQLFKKIKKNKREVRELKTQVDKIEEMMTRMLELTDKKQQKKAERRRSLMQQSAIPEHSADDGEEE